MEGRWWNKNSNFPVVQNSFSAAENEFLRRNPDRDSQPAVEKTHCYSAGNSCGALW